MPQNRVKQHLLTGALVAAATALGQLISVELWMTAPRAHMLWLPGAVLMCALLALPRRRWAACVAGALIGTTGFLALLGTPVGGVVVVLLGVFLLVVLASLVLKRTDFRFSLVDFRGVLRFVVVAGLVLPVLAAYWVTQAMPRFGLAHHIGGWINVALAHSLSYLLVVPGFLSLLLQRAQPERRWRPSAINLFALVVMVVLLSIAWTSEVLPAAFHAPLMLAPAILLIWCLIVNGPVVSSITLLCITLLCMHFCSHGMGPMVVPDLGMTTLSVQLWASCLAVAHLYLATLVEQRTSDRASLSRAYRRLSELTGRMLVVQEAERTRIAQDLHDDINQSLASVSIQLSALKREAAPDERARLEDIQQQVQDVSGDIRRISHALHPSILRYTSLSASLIGLCQAQGTEGGLQMDCSRVEDLPLSCHAKLNLFRVAQEALHNVGTHAQATWVRIRLYREHADVVLQVDDNGKGLPDHWQRLFGQGLGLLSMEERARSLGGRLEIRNREEGGTRVELRCPLSAAEA